MAPIRRYLRITKFSVLEVRIYLDDPTQAQTWLLHGRDPALPRIVQAIRPLVLPKLREENERVKGKSKKAKGVKDTVVQGMCCDFEVAIFLTDTASRHAVLTKTKVFQEQKRIKSNSGKLTNWVTKEDEAGPIAVDDDDDDQAPAAPTIAIREESDDEATNLDDFAPAPAEPPRKRQRRQRPPSDADLFVPEGEPEPEISEDEGFADGGPSDDKKKLGLHTAYDGFSIYGKILCLIVKRRGNYRSHGTVAAEGAETGRQMLENFVSTQAQGLGAFVAADAPS